MRKMTVSAIMLRIEPKLVICARSPWATVTILLVSMVWETWLTSVDWSTPNLASRSWILAQIAWNLAV